MLEFIGHTTDTQGIGLRSGFAGVLRGVFDERIQGHQAVAEVQHPQAHFRPLSDVIHGAPPLQAPVHYASQQL